MLRMWLFLLAVDLNLRLEMGIKINLELKFTPDAKGRAISGGRDICLHELEDAILKLSRYYW